MIRTNKDGVVSSDTLKAFIKMHEYKLNAKINDMKAGRLEARLHNSLRHGDIKMLED